MKVEKKKMGRPRKEIPNTTVYSFKIRQKQLKKLKAYALLTGKTTAEIVRAAIDSYITIDLDENET